MNEDKMQGTAGPGEIKAAWFMPEQLALRPVSELVPYARNARTHSAAQIVQLQASIREFGFVNPVLIDGENNIIAGHGRVLAAQAEGMTDIPCVLVEHLSDTQRRAYILADNRLAEMSDWDMDMVSQELQKLNDDNFDLTLTGFDDADMEMEPPDPVDLSNEEDDEPTGNRVLHCPKCGFVFEVPG